MKGARARVQERPLGQLALLAAAGAHTVRPRRLLTSLVPTLPRPVWLLQAGGLVNALGSGLVFPFVLVYLHDVRGLTLATAGAVAGTFGFAGIVATPAAGVLVDRFGAQRVLRVSLVLLAAGYGLFPLIRTPWQAFAFMALAGLGNAGFWPSQSALAMGLTPAAARHHSSAVARAVYNLGVGAGAALGGVVLGTGTPRAFAVLFVLDAATFLFFAALTFFLPGAAAAGHAAGGYRAVARNRVFLALLALNVVFVTAAYAPFEAGLPLFARDHLHLTPQAIGVVFLANMLGVAVLQLPVAKLLEGRRRMAALAAMTAACAAAFLLVAVGGTFPPVLIAAAVLFAAGECVLGPVVGPLVVGLAPEELRGRYLALLTSSYAIGFAVGPPLAAVVLAWSPTALWPLAGAVLLAAGVAGLVLERALPPAERRTP